MMTDNVFLWWLFLCVVSGLNILAWSLSCAVLAKRRATMPPDAHATRRLLLILCAGYTLGCAYRAVMPVYDVPRLTLFDTWLASVFIGRSVATIAELCFAAQWALLLREFSRAGGSTFGSAAARLIVPLIVIAECCSWYSVLTTSNLGHAFEESIWGLCAVLIVVSLLTLTPRYNGRVRQLLWLWSAAGAMYVGYIYLVDVPMYWSRWIADEATGRTYLSFADGLHDILGRWVVSHHWHEWRSEVVWMTLYFSVGVWVSISLVHAPVLTPGINAKPRPRSRLSMAVR